VGGLSPAIERDGPAGPWLQNSRFGKDWIFGSAFGKIVRMAHFAIVFRSIMELDRKNLYKAC
jgi:hypothetical protein